MKTYTLSDGQARGKRWLYLVVAAIFLAGYLYLTLGRPLPLLVPSEDNDIQAQAPSGALNWPAAGQSAVGIVGSSTLETHGDQKPTPTASTAKLITALVVLKAKPLHPGQQGPTITLKPRDVTIYNDYISQDGSLVKVQAGEQISEYQMLQTIMLPSANNMADSLAIWAFGSLKAYSAAANQYLASQGLDSTHVGKDASGFSPGTTSTAADLVRIGELTMRDPVLSQIVGQSTASGIPIVNNIKNVNQLLGSDGIVGIKTGNTDQAGGVFVSASHVTVNGKQVTIVTALANSPSLFQAMKDSLPLIRSAQANFKPLSIVTKGLEVGQYKQPWGNSVPAVASQDITLKVWSGGRAIAKVKLHDTPASSRAGQQVGSVVVPNSAVNNQLSVPVQLQAKPSQPGIGWRLTHPF